MHIVKRQTDINNPGNAETEAKTLAFRYTHKYTHTHTHTHTHTGLTYKD